MDLLEYQSHFYIWNRILSSPLVPIYCFGENDIYDQVDNPDGSLIRAFQNKVMELFTFAPLFFTGAVKETYFLINHVCIYFMD